MTNKEITPWDRLKTQFKPDGKGRYKTTDAMKVAIQIDNERKELIKIIEELKKNKNGLK